jgi:hypothetical protein
MIGRSMPALVLASLLLAPMPARAQQAGAPATPSGPLVLERVGSGVVAAPDFKIAEVDDTVGTLVGGYVGWVGDQRLLIGGAAYWLANGRDDLKMAYGGLLVGWTFNGDGRIAFGAKSLAGVGQATLSDTFVIRSIGRANDRPRDVRFAPGAGGSVTRDFIFDRTFAVLEPQGHLVIRLTDTIRLDCGVGYRVIGAAGGFEERLRGASGSVAVRFGAGQ